MEIRLNLIKINMEMINANIFFFEKLIVRRIIIYPFFFKFSQIFTIHEFISFSISNEHFSFSAPLRVIKSHITYFFLCMPPLIKKISYN